MRNCINCKNLYFSLQDNDLFCDISNSPIPDNMRCESWHDKYESTRCDNWREDDLSLKRHSRFKQLDKIGRYMKRKYNVWLWTTEAQAHDIMGNHIGW